MVSVVGFPVVFCVSVVVCSFVVSALVVVCVLVDVVFLDVSFVSVVVNALVLFGALVVVDSVDECCGCWVVVCGALVVVGGLGDNSAFITISPRQHSIKQRSCR